jgi:AcrR family transcriptional regulator
MGGTVGVREARRYHHGNLRDALIAEGLATTRRDGPESVSLREITRSVGVTVNAAYRHFVDRDAYVAALATAAQRQASLAIERGLVVDQGGRARLRSVGRGYISFARAEPGWFRTAFMVPEDLTRTGRPDAAGATGRTPLQLLGDALDQLVAEGELAPTDRLGAEVPCWSAVHGFASLALLGPLRGLPAATLDVLADRTVDVAIDGLLG